MILRRLWLLVPVLILSIACTEAPKEAKKKEPEKPPEAVTGQKAFHQMYISARTWAPDVQGLQCMSINLPEVKSVDGKYGAWQCSFVSPSRGKLKSFTYSVIEAGGNLHKGVFGGLDETFTGSRGQAKPWNTQALKIDTDDAYQTAIKKSADYIKKNPTMPVSFLLEMTPRFPNLVWRVIWGESVNTSNYSIFVDASTGEYTATGR